MEMLGDPMCDVGFNCLIYHLGLNLPALKGIHGLPYDQLGIPACIRFYLATIPIFNIKTLD